MLESADTLLKQAFQARRSRRFGDAKRDLLEAVDLCRTEGSPVDLALALTRLGAIERDMGNRAVALEHYGEAVAIYRAEEQVYRLAHSVRHLGDIHMEMNRADLAEPCYIEALELYRAQSEVPPLDLANAIRGYALLQSGAGQRQQARALWTEARDLYAGLGLDIGVEESSKQLAALK